MTDLSNRIAALTPEQRAVFELLRKSGAKKRPAHSAAPPPIPRRAEAGPAPLSFDQERLWFLGQLDPESAAYNIDTAIRMKGPLDVPVLKAALGEIVRRHAAWRTVFPAIDGRPAQVALPELALEIPVVDLREIPVAEREAAGLAMAIEEARTPMDLARGPLVRVRLLRLADDEHICLMTVHHIVSDWVSFTLAWMEIAALYPAFLAGEPSPLPEPPVQYADFAVWQRSWLAGEALENAIDFWTKELAEFPHVLELPTDRPRPAAQTTRGGRARVTLPSARAEAFRALARKEGVTPFIATLAAFDALLCRWSGQEKILVGSPNANRNRPEIESLLGFFVSQLVFATDMSGDPPFREILARARKTALAAYAHQELPFGKLVEALRLERDASRPPLAQVNLLLLDTASSSTIELPSLTFSGVDVDDGSSPFDTTLMLFDGAASGIHGWFEYNLDLWDGTTIARVAEAFEILVERVSADPAARLAEIPLLREGAAHQVLREWNDTAALGDLRSADRLFEERAAETPGAPALVVADPVFSDLVVTYGELDRAANRLAHRLCRLGVTRESRVGLRTGRGPELLVGLLGIWKAGGAYVPLDPGYPEERLAFLLEDAGIEVVVTEAKLPGRLPEGRVRTVALEGVASLAGEPETRPEGGAEPGDLAYVIYTSGTTGRPKGVMAEHGNLASTLLASLLEFGWGPGDRIPALAPFSFDIFLFEVMSPLTTGGTVELVPLVPALDLDRLMAVLPAATRLHAVPALMRQICALVRAGAARPADLRTLFVGGDAVPPDLLAEMREAFPGAEIRILYGPTEGTVICASFAVPSEAGSVSRAMLGRPLANVDLRLYDRQGGLALVGAPGELWIGGPGVTRGYLNREDLTAEKFVTRDGRRWYRTGDLARRLPDGSLEFAGRVDQQVKVRGFRVEPGEIEARLAAHPAVKEAVVLARGVEGGDKRLAAYVVTGEGAGEEALRAWVGEALPEYMVPSLVVILPELPVTAHGKVDRKALLALEAPRDAGPAPRADRTAPRTPAEEILAGIWRGVLRVEEVGVHDNFFRLGGDSILSIQVVARARQAGLGLTPRQMFESQTIATLAAVAVPARQEEEQGEVEGEAPLTPIQLRFFAEEREDPGWFNQTLVFEVREALDPTRLRQAITALVEHHDALRLRFLEEDGRWRQVHAPVEETPFTWIDGPALPEVRELQTGFDLAAGPLFRAVLLTGASGAQQLLFAAHHLIVDGVSWRILLEDLATAYAGHPLPAKTTSWRRWAERLAAHARSEEILAELPVWREDLSAEIPADRNAGPNTSGSSFQVESALDAETTDALLKRAPEAYRTEINDLLLAALARTLSAWTGVGRHRIELEGHGREEVVPGVDLSRTVGWFTTAFPVVLDVEERSGLGEAIRAIKETLRAIPNRGIGYGLLRYLSPERESLASTPEPEVGFNYLGRVDGAVPGALVPVDEPTGPSESPRAPRRHLLDVDAVVLGGRLRVTWTASRNRHGEATVERLARAFLAEVETLVAHCLSPEAGGYTPSDFSLARLDATTIDAVLGRDRTVEDVYPLAPLQRGMLFHTLYAPGSELYFEQLAATVRGDLDVDAFGRAFQQVVDREPVLRTAFLWEGLPEPLQVVRHGVEMPWVLEDWRGVPAGEVDGRFAAYAAADRARGFDLGRPPLQRAALLRTGEEEYRLLWSFHHLLFDGWCFSLLFREIFTFYAAWRGGGAAEPGPVHPYREYIAWLQKRDLGQAEAWWRERLSSFTAATPLPFEAEGREGRAAGDYEERGIVVAAPLAASLQTFAQREGITLNTLVQGAWALLLSRMSGARDVVFGAVAAGRPADLPGVEEMIGLFINTLPVRVDADPGAGVAAWLRDLQAAQVEMRSWEWSPLLDVQRWSGVPPGEPLFHSLLVFENYPIDPSVGSRLPELSIDAVEVSERTNYPLTLTAVMRDELLLRASFDRRIAAPTAEKMLGHLEALLAALAADPGRALGDLPAVPDLVVRELPRSPVLVPEGAATPPRTAVEEALSRVWRAVLRLDRVGVHDDFFRLGGDSILSLQIVVKAREEGLHVTPKQLFENPTIAALASMATPLAEPVAETGAAEGEAPLTPIQRFFFENGGSDLHWFNQALLLEVRERTAPAVLARASAALLAAHGALRLRFDGARRAAVAPAGGEVPFLWVDLSALPKEVRSRAVERASAELQTGFDLARGPLFLAAFFDPGRLLLAAHHLAVDAVSWRILLEDLETACRQIEAGEPVRLPAPTLSWRGWAERLAGHARSAEVRAELPLWLDAPAVRPLPVDFPAGENTAGSAASVSLAFPPEATEALLREAPRAYNTRVDDLLLTALVRAFARWTGEPRLRLDLEAHGREEIASGIDLSRTVGWFTAVHPVTLDLAGASSPGTAILAVKERLRAVPRRGIGYGLLRWLGDDETRERLAALPEPEIAFNNLGQLDQALGDRGRFAPAPEPTGPSQSPRARRSHAIEINALVLDGRLRVDWNYSAGLHAAETIERLAAGFQEELEGLIAHCLSPEAGGFSPSDFPLARLDPAGLEAAVGADRSVEDLYPLAPLQKGMLLHGIWAPESPLYLEQLYCDLMGDLDVSAFTRAWQRVVDRHAALRTAFVWRGLPAPLQAVRREVELPWILEDFRDLPGPDERVHAWLAEDSARVFDLTRPPLLRAALLSTGEARVRFVWTFHHLLFDGWCFALLFREVFAFYEAFRRGEDLRLPEPRPYRDYIAWLAERNPGEAEAYWRGVLAGFESPTPLPLDAPGATPPAHPVPRERELVLSPVSTAVLEAFAQGRRLTVNTLVQAAWGLLLSRMADLRDVVFGTVVSGRPPELPGVESMVGLFINTLPVRMDVDLAAPVAAWLRQVQEDQVAMRQHEWSPLADVQGWSGLPPGEPLFYSLLAFENYPVDDSLGEGAGDLAVRGVVISDRTDYPLSLAALPGGTELAFRLAHDHRTDASTAERLLGHLETLLAGLAAHPDRRLGEVPLLTGPERGQLLAWSPGERAPLEETCLHELFEIQAGRTPGAVALVDDAGQTTYAELERRANRLANTLRGLGVGPEVRVGLHVSRSAEMVTAILGILKAGGAYVPVDPETPADRVAFLLEDTPVVVTESSLPLPSPIRGQTLLLNDPSWLAAPDTRPASGVTPESLAYVIYTSGSTGLPKGVMVRHRSAVTYARAMAAVYGIGPGDRALEFASIGFDASIEEIFTPLGWGAALFIRTGVDDVSAFLARCRGWRLTHLSLPTAYWHQIAAALESEGADLHPELRLVVIGGERALPERWAAWGRGPGARVRLVNSYGPTEATIAATIYERPGTADATPRREVPIGRPLPRVEAHVLGRDLRLMPVSALGELCLGGDCLARGYLDRPDLTAEKFVPDPFGEAGTRLYRTGDLVRRLPDGTLEFAGRVDAQVKIRGFRIELGEVEAALSAHPGVKEAVATTREDASGSRRLVAFAVPLAPGDPLSDLRPFLAGRLPAYMVPSDLGVLDALPVTPAGKLDRRALDAIGISREPEVGFVAPRNPIEEEIAAIWSELLGVERVGVDDDFFALGGHSLLATQLVSRVRRQLGVDLPLHQLFELRILGDLAREVLAQTLAEADGMDGLMAELDGLSDEEALALLGEEGA